ncbi:MAG: hypothetical protein K5877_09570 [Lachnospiraceae bacterium]|nr:hypothetical protein [Lachnospiraceae bacterium]
MRNKKFGNFAITAIVTVLSAISGYATAQYIKSKENEARVKSSDRTVTVPDSDIKNKGHEDDGTV